MNDIDQEEVFNRLPLSDSQRRRLLQALIDGTVNRTIERQDDCVSVEDSKDKEEAQLEPRSQSPTEPD